MRIGLAHPQGCHSFPLQECKGRDNLGRLASKEAMAEQALAQRSGLLTGRWAPELVKLRCPDLGPALRTADSMRHSSGTRPGKAAGSSFKNFETVMAIVDVLRACQPSMKLRRSSHRIVPS